VTLIVSASFVSLPKITQWISSPDAADRRRLLLETNRLNVFQIVPGCAAALGYLALNDLFIKFWLGAGYQAPLSWQLAFACNLAITTGGDAGIQIAGRCGTNGLRTAGLAIGGTGILNLLLSLVSMKLGSITGIAIAAVIAQSVVTLVLGYVTCRHLGLSVVRWGAKSWLIPIGVVLAAGGLRFWLPDQSLGHLGVLGGAYVLLLLAACWLVGMNRELLRAELTILRSMLKR
jgi:O-antigen/teichoic acid export membrane protein